jgi:uroporphyrinogen III methyltransferase/synthase
MHDNKIGTVYLVGAGPGDPELITVRGRRLLTEADAVVYDNLIPLELVVTLPDRIERVYVGKQSSLHALPQDEINLLLVKLARQGKMVVRLKGGDPCMFGRGGEEATALGEHGIPYEIVPGVTAGTAALAYAGIPPTDRRAASTVIYATGHRCMSRENLVNWSWIAKSHDTTVVIYMGVKELPAITERLIACGMAPEMPAAVIERGTHADQRVITARLDRLVEEAERADVRPPALIVVGDVVRLRKDIDWFGHLPLAGKRVLVTRPADQSDLAYLGLRRLGAEVLPYPTIATRDATTEASWQRVLNVLAVNQWLVFTSENGVRYFLPQFLKRVGDVRMLWAYKIAAVGFGTANALREYHISPNFVPSQATTAALAEELTESCVLSGATIVRVRGNYGDDRVERRLEEAGATVVPFQSYETFTPLWPLHLKAKLLNEPPDYILFTSGSACDGYMQNLSGAELEKMATAKIVSIGPTTSEIICGHGLEVAVEAEVHSVEGAIAALAGSVGGHDCAGQPLVESVSAATPKSD